MLIPFGTLAASGGVAGTFELISTEILGSSQSGVTFSSLGSYSSTYRHLQIRAVTIGGSTDSLRLRLNGDTGSNYGQRQLGSSGPSVFYNGDVNSTSIYTGMTNTAYGCPSITDILDAFSTTKNKTVRTFTGLSDYVFLRSGHYRSSSSVTSVTVYSETNLAAGSRISLYGIR
jgi:hypothetical protein